MKSIKSVGEEYQVVKGGREYPGYGEEYNVEKRERGSNMIFPLILRLLGNKIKIKIYKKKIKKIKKNWGWQRI